MSHKFFPQHFLTLNNVNPFEQNCSPDLKIYFDFIPEGGGRLKSTSTKNVLKLQVTTQNTKILQCPQHQTANNIRIGAKVVLLD